MRDIEDIIKELVSHPDYINHIHIWTTNSVMSNISGKIYSSTVDYSGDTSFDWCYEEEEEEEEEDNRPVITKNMFTDEDWVLIKDRIYEEEMRISFSDFEIIPYNVELLSFYRSELRNIQIDKLLNDKDETKN